MTPHPNAGNRASTQITLKTYYFYMIFYAYENM